MSLGTPRPAGVADPTLHAAGLHIGGAWHRGRDIIVSDPATGAILAEVADASEADALCAADAAHAAAPGWRATSPRPRAEVQRRRLAPMTDLAVDLALRVAPENGKALRDARGEVADSGEFFGWCAEEAVRIPGEFRTAPSGAHRILADHEPIGIAVLVASWNFPAAMATRKIGPALAAGCTVILKPTSETPLAACVLARLGEEAGVPPGVVNVLTTSRPGPVVAAMLADPQVRKPSFTGSTGVGRTQLAEAARTVVSCSTEPGGNAPFLVLHDAFVAGLAWRMGALRMGPGRGPATVCGSKITACAVAKIEVLVADAVARSARVVTGRAAPAGTGHFCPPTVPDRVPADAAMAHEETFGAVAPVTRFATECEAVAMASDTEYGLVAYVYTRDLGRGQRIGWRPVGGMVALNRGLMSDPATPFGGVKQSGLGREGGVTGNLEHMEPKYHAVDL